MLETTNTGKKIRFDDSGFLIEREDWDDEVAQFIATREHMKKLSHEQLEIINFMRNYYDKFKFFPILSYVCKNVHQPGKCVVEQFINPELAWKIAGLPKLDGIHFVTMDCEHYIMEECC